MERCYKCGKRKGRTERYGHFDADSDPTMKVVITKLLNSRTLFIIELKLGVVNMFCLCQKKLFLEVHYAFQLDEGHDD